MVEIPEVSRSLPLVGLMSSAAMRKSVVFPDRTEALLDAVEGDAEL
jgi:hypothetical protein